MARTDRSAEKVKAYEGSITLPTYAIRGENRNPVFHSQYGVAHIYPYTLLDDIDPHARDKTYKTLNLENRYLLLTVLPDLGGRVYSLYDKLSGREVFYKNRVIKFAPLAIRGAFFSGGLEFSFPVAHAPTTADAVNWDLIQNEDASATIALGGIEHIGRLRWTIFLTLFPDRCALAQDVQLHNPTSVPGRYHYWTNASLPADDQTEFIYPLRRFRSYEFAGTASWPTARIDLLTQDPRLEGMEGVPTWPAPRLHEPADLRWQKNMIAQVSIFGRDVRWNFFGAWQHSANHGYAHYADHRHVSGMKLWSWGNAGVGVMNQAALTDDGSLYAETQCGAMETQLDFDFLPPGGTRRWREWWLPLRGLGGLTCASADVGARIGLGEPSPEGEARVTLGLCPAHLVANARVHLSVPGKIILEEVASLAPDKPWLATATIDSSLLGDQPISLRVTDRSGAAILEYVHDRSASAIDASSPGPGTPAQTAEDFYALGLKHENFDNREQALEAYRQAISLDPGHALARLRLGLMLVRAADSEEAEAHLRHAASLGLPEANFHLGSLMLTLDRVVDAEESFKKVPAGSDLFAAALCGLGRTALGRREWMSAAKFFEDAGAAGGSGLVTSLLSAVALRRGGQEESARAKLVELLKIDPLNHMALRELAFILGSADHRYAPKLERLLSDDRQYVLDLACSYIAARLPNDALEILTEAGSGWDYPMVGYLGWHLSRLLGCPEAEATQWLARAMAGGPDMVFPSRLEEAIALDQRIKDDSTDLKAKAYLACFLYAHQRHDEAVMLWEEASSGLSTYDMLFRNLGLAYWQRRADLAQATRLFEKALEINPRNQDLYLHLDRLYKEQGLTDQRKRLLGKMKMLADPRDDVHKRIVIMHVELGEHGEALQMLAKDSFVPSEMDQSFRSAYVSAHLAKAQSEVEAGRLEEAIALYRNALQYPLNVGTGRPLSSNDAEILYRLGCACEKLGRFGEALTSWRQAATEHHPHGCDLFAYVQMSLDKLNRYSEVGLGGSE